MPDTDAIDLLIADHRAVEKLFAQFKKAENSSEKKALVEKISVELKVHMQIEEEIFYPALRGKLDADEIDEAMIEHDASKLLINDLAHTDVDDEYYGSKVKVLGEEVDHHIKEEEKEDGSVFDEARKTDVDMNALGKKLATRKAELMEQAKSEGLPAAEMVAVHEPIG